MLIDRRRVDGVIVAMNFTFWRCQPSKERAHPAYEFWGDTDGTREVPELIAQEEVKRWIRVLFNLTGRRKVENQQRAFNVGTLPLEVRVVVLVWPNSFLLRCSHSCSQRSVGSTEQHTSQPCHRRTGRGVLMPGRAVPSVEPAQRLVG